MLEVERESGQSMYLCSIGLVGVSSDVEDVLEAMDDRLMRCTRAAIEICV